MYGLVNKGIQEFAISQGGDELWEKILDASGIDESIFLSMESYPDEITYRLVGAAEKILGIPSNDILCGFGQFWVEFTGKAGYGDLMAVGGTTLIEFLKNLDSMHARVKVSLDKLQPPRFECVEKNEHIELHYYSKRIGLDYMVVGLIEGLAEKFGEAVKVHIEKVKSGEDDKSIFIIKHI